MKQKYFIFDFDSTFIKDESIDCLAHIAFSKNSNIDQNKIVSEIENITNLAMTGQMGFTKALKERLKLLAINKKHVDKSIEYLKTRVTESFKKHRLFFQLYKHDIYVISGGFVELIWPVVKDFGLIENQVYGNQFNFDYHGNITGFDEHNVLSQKEGKGELLKSLNLKGDIYVIGDGYNDFSMKTIGQAHKFIAFTENVKRDTVVEIADSDAINLDEALVQCEISDYNPEISNNVLLLENIHINAVMKFENRGFNTKQINDSLSKEDLREKIKDITFLGIRSKTEVTKEVLEKAEKLQAIGVFCIGTNQVDLKECARRGIAVFNAPYSNTRSVVELAIGEIIMLMRNIFDKASFMHQSKWHKSSNNANEVRGKKLGIIGYGNIGSQLSVVAESLGMQVYFYDKQEKMPLGNACACDSMYALLRKCDVITVHVDGHKDNKNLISDNEFQEMQDGAIFLNLSRGFVVDVDALAKAIDSKKIRGAAIDVYSQEPKEKQAEFNISLQNKPNVILTPHIGGSTVEAQESIANFVAKKITDYYELGTTSNSVNFPELQLPEIQATHRVIHIHNNVPGILAKINELFAKYKINIEGQYLKTNDYIGYVITDVVKVSDELLTELKEIPETIKFRVLY